MATRETLHDAGPHLATIDRVSGAVLVLLGAAMLWESRALPMGTLGKPGPAFLPVVLAGVVIALAVLVVVFGGRSPLLRTVDWSEAGHAASTVAACVFAVFALERLGYRITMAVTTGFLLGATGRCRPVVIVTIGLGFALVSYWVFRHLGVLLPDGPLGF